MKIEHRPQCHILAAPDGEYVTDIDCDCGATYYTLTSCIAELVDALRELRDRQNGPPLIRDAAQWEAAMAKADAVLAKHERK